jgi:CheY-like chemotaxis protein
MRPRVLLLDDDDLVRALITFALEDMDIDLVECVSVAQALQQLHDEPVQLLLTDLMMPGESGLSFIGRLADKPQLAGGARIVVFSAGLTTEVRAQLAPLPIWRLLSKPASITAIRSCVEDGLAAARADGAASGAAPAPAPPAVDSVAAAYFNGDAALSESYRRTCLQQFPIDVRRGDAAVAQTDLAALRRLAHDLKSVLQILGHDTLAQQARALEDASAAGDAPVSLQLWVPVRTGLQALVRG